VEDLRPFFDYYLKKHQERMAEHPSFPRQNLRCCKSVAKKTGKDFTTTAYPPPEAKLLTLYLDRNAEALTFSTTEEPSQVEVKPATDDVLFNLTFSKKRLSVASRPSALTSP
jgi:hypothetical protein